jgi:signal transduction histidine kinase
VRLPLHPTVRGRLALLLVAMYVLTTIVLQVVLLIVLSIRHPAGPPSDLDLLVRYCAALVITAALACGLAWPAAGRILRPLRQITDTARRITGEDLHERLALSGPADELTELGDTFDAMLARLEAAFASQQLFAANAAHELRTPLAVLRAELDLLLTGPEPSPAEFRDAAIRLRRTVLGSERLLERLLTLTRGMLAPGEREPVPLDQVAEQALADAALATAGLDIRPELRAACALGDPSLLGELAGNLIGNAVAYNCPDGWIAVGTRTDGDRVILEVANSGQLIADSDLDGLLEPFRRAGQQRTGRGSGLGLSIVRAIVTAHGGELGLRALPDGGLAIQVALPAAPPGPSGAAPAAPGGAAADGAAPDAADGAAPDAAAEPHPRQPRAL